MAQITTTNNRRNTGKKKTEPHKPKLAKAKKAQKGQRFGKS